MDTNLNNFLLHLKIDKWNRMVPKSYTLVDETDTHWVFLHKTKGYRTISKRRLPI